MTSANVSGRPAPTSAQEALADLAGRVDLVLDGGTCPQGVASSIVDLSVSPPRLLRQGHWMWKPCVRFCPISRYSKYP